MNSLTWQSKGNDLYLLHLGFGKVREKNNLFFSMLKQLVGSWFFSGRCVLGLRHTSRGDMSLVLPWWFPLPDAVVKATFQAGIRYMFPGSLSRWISNLLVICCSKHFGTLKAEFLDSWYRSCWNDIFNDRSASTSVTYCMVNDRLWRFF